MADNLSNISSANSIQQAATNAINPKDTSGAASSELSSLTGGNNGIASQEEFLNLLVHQLQNQDPLNPMDNQEFAVQLAQFSQLEQLIEIKDTMSSLDTLNDNLSSGVGVMASFLGNEVVLNQRDADILNGKGPNLILNIPEGTREGRVDLINANGEVQTSIPIENIGEGTQVQSLDGLEIPNGSYEIRAVTVGRDGRFNDIDAKVSGTVEGFVMEPEAALLVDGNPIKLQDVVEVFEGNRSA